MTAGHDDSIRVWETGTYTQVFKLHGHGRLGGKYQLAIAPDSQTFSSFGPDLFLRSWDLQTGKALTEQAIRPEGMPIKEDEDGNVRAGGGYVDAYMDPSRLSRFSADGKLLFVPVNSELHVFDVASGKKSRRFAPGDAPVQEFALSPTGKWLITAASQPEQPSELRIVDLASNDVAVHRKLEGKHLGEFRFSKDGALCAINVYSPGMDRDQWISVWVVESGEEFVRLRVKALGMAFSPENTRLATGNPDSSVLIWDLHQARRAQD